MRFLYVCTKEEDNYHEMCRDSIISLRKFHSEKVVVYSSNQEFFSDLGNVEVRPLPPFLRNLDRIAIRNHFREKLYSGILFLLKENEEEEPTIWIDCDTLFVAPIPLSNLDDCVYIHSYLCYLGSIPEFHSLVRAKKASPDQKEVKVIDSGVLHIPRRFFSRLGEIVSDLSYYYRAECICLGRVVSLTLNLLDVPKVECHKSVQHFSTNPKWPSIEKVRFSPTSSGSLSIVLTTSERRLLGFSFLPMALCCCAHQEMKSEVVVVGPPTLSELPFNEAESILGAEIDRSFFKLIHFEGRPWQAKNRGIQECGGKVISVFDDDNYYGPKYISSALSSILSEDCNVVCGCDKGVIYDLVFKSFEVRKITSPSLFTFTRDWLVNSDVMFLPANEVKREDSLEKEGSKVSTKNAEGNFVYVRSLGNLTPVRAVKRVDRDLGFLRLFVGNDYVDRFYEPLADRIEELTKEE